MVVRDQLQTSCKVRLLESPYWIFDVCIKLRVSTGRKAGRIKINDERSKRITKKNGVLRTGERDISKQDHFAL